YLYYLNNIPIQRGKYRIGHLLFKLLNYAIYEVNGILIELNPVSLIDRKIILTSSHDPIVLDLISSVLKHGGIFLDIGANIGYFSLLAAQIPNVQVISFEPSSRELVRFYRNIALNQLSNITVFPYGLSEETASVPLYIHGDNNPGMNSAINLQDLFSYLKYDQVVNCNFVPLDCTLSEFLLSKVYLCKIDVEGYEMSVLKGMSKSLKYMLNTVFVVEISPDYLKIAGYDPQDIYDFFESHGYQPKFGISYTQQYDEVFVRREP
ncbi:MAG: FkbM family methyltransferase, partial [Dolichospermum sp.]